MASTVFLFELGLCKTVVDSLNWICMDYRCLRPVFIYVIYKNCFGLFCGVCFLEGMGVPMHAL